MFLVRIVLPFDSEEDVDRFILENDRFCVKHHKPLIFIDKVKEVTE